MTAADSLWDCSWTTNGRPCDRPACAMRYVGTFAATYCEQCLCVAPDTANALPVPTVHDVMCLFDLFTQARLVDFTRNVRRVAESLNKKHTAFGKSTAILRLLNREAAVRYINQYREERYVNEPIHEVRR